MKRLLNTGVLKREIRKHTALIGWATTKECNERSVALTAMIDASPSARELWTAINTYAELYCGKQKARDAAYAVLVELLGKEP
jgi:hypothetical protein